jgi:hypothetical protein
VSSIPSIDISVEKKLKFFKDVSLGSIIDSSLKIGKEYVFLEFTFESDIEFLKIIPDFILLSFTIRKKLLNIVSCFLKKSTDDVFCFIKKYSSCKDEL